MLVLPRQVGAVALHTARTQDATILGLQEIEGWWPNKRSKPRPIPWLGCETQKECALACRWQQRGEEVAGMVVSLDGRIHRRLLVLGSLPLCVEELH